MQQLNSNSGNNQDEFWRAARNEGYFSYEMATNAESGLCLIVRYWGAEQGNRKFEIYINDEKLVSENNTGKWNQNRFMEIEYQVPDSMIKSKKNLRVKFQAQPGSSTSAVYFVRLVRKNTER
jgi:hypothetical protein